MTLSCNNVLYSSYEQVEIFREEAVSSHLLNQLSAAGNKVSAPFKRASCVPFSSISR